LLFGILQEALTNIARHAEADHAAVAVAVADGVIELSVSDDGKGLPEEHSGRSAGLGLISIRERAQSLGGSASWDRGSLGGTRLLVRVPLEQLH
jgi:signal transduction histidine kinase